VKLVRNFSGFLLMVVVALAVPFLAAAQDSQVSGVDVSSMATQGDDPGPGIDVFNLNRTYLKIPNDHHRTPKALTLNLGNSFQNQRMIRIRANPGGQPGNGLRPWHTPYHRSARRFHASSPRQEPHAVLLHVRICAVAAGDHRPYRPRPRKAAATRLKGQRERMVRQFVA
jgi:hypothetical protein